MSELFNYARPRWSFAAMLANNTGNITGDGTEVVFAPDVVNRDDLFADNTIPLYDPTTGIITPPADGYLDLFGVIFYNGLTIHDGYIAEVRYMLGGSPDFGADAHGPNLSLYGLGSTVKAPLNQSVGFMSSFNVTAGLQIYTGFLMFGSVADVKFVGNTPGTPPTNNIGSWIGGTFSL